MEENKEYPKTFEDLFKGTGIEDVKDEQGNTHFNFKARKLNNINDFIAGEKRWGIVCKMLEERISQDKKWNVQNHPIVNEWDANSIDKYGIVDENNAKILCNNAAKGGYLTWAHILIEEVSEALHASNKELMREELIQCAAVVVAMIESLDRNGK